MYVAVYREMNSSHSFHYLYLMRLVSLFVSGLQLQDIASQHLDCSTALSIAALWAGWVEVEVPIKKANLAWRAQSYRCHS